MCVCVCLCNFVVGLRHMEWRVAGVVRVVDGWFCFRWIIVAIMLVVIPAAWTPNGGEWKRRKRSTTLQLNAKTSVNILDANCHPQTKCTGVNANKHNVCVCAVRKSYERGENLKLCNLISRRCNKTFWLMCHSTLYEWVSDNCR